MRRWLSERRQRAVQAQQWSHADRLLAAQVEAGYGPAIQLSALLADARDKAAK